MDEIKPEENVINITTNWFGFLSQSFFHNFLISWYAPYSVEKTTNTEAPTTSMFSQVPVTQVAPIKFIASLPIVGKSVTPKSAIIKLNTNKNDYFSI